MRLSPIRNASTPHDSIISSSLRSKNPLSLTLTTSAGRCGSRARVVSRLTSKVRRFRLLTPTTRGCDVEAQQSVELFAVMHFPEHVHTQSLGAARKGLEVAIFERRENQQDRIGSRCPRLEDLVLRRR